MKAKEMRRLLGMARESEMKGWKGLVQADATLALAGEDRGAVGRAMREAAEAKGHFKDAATLLEEVERMGGRE